MSNFTIGEKVQVEGVGISCIGTVGMAGVVSDIFGTPIGKLGVFGMLFDNEGEQIGKVNPAQGLDCLPGKTSLPASPGNVPLTPTPRFESFEQKGLDDTTRRLKDIEGGYEWFNK